MKNPHKKVLFIFLFVLVIRLFFAFETPTFTGDTAYGSIRQVESIVETGFPLFYDPLDQNNSIFITRALDLGAKGIIVPRVNYAEDVEMAEKAIYYPPKGERGIGYSKTNNYGIEFDEYFKSSNDDVLFVVQIEHEVAVKNIDDILSSKNIDSYIIGPYDLTGSMGIVGEFDNPNYLNNLDIIKKSAVKNGIRSGIHVVSPEVNQLKTAINEGYEFIAHSTDALLMYDRCKTDLNSVRKLRI